MASSIQISSMIVSQLVGGEKRILSLTMGVRRALGQPNTIKGDLSTIVKASLRQLVASKTIVEADGMYSLCA